MTALLWVSIHARSRSPLASSKGTPLACTLRPGAWPATRMRPESMRSAPMIARAQSAPDPGWEFTLTPYGWFAGLNGTITTPKIILRPQVS